MSEMKSIDIWEQPREHECRAVDGGPAGPRTEPCGDGEVEVIYPCAASGTCPWRRRAAE